ncbi:MAG: 6-carboxytetrahydropterin synthase [Chloroflexi bacterium]|nr:6-carboxytetrahydropterin synthase [Chloroflexota bacterium]
MEIRAVVTLRITRDIGLAEIAEELSVPLEVVERRLGQGGALLQRTLGAGFEIEYVPPTAPEVPPAAEPALVAVRAGRPSLADFVSDSLRGIEPLAVPGRDLTDQNADAQETLREALSEAAEIFRLASQRLGLPREEREPLRRLLQDKPPGYITLTASEVSDTAGYLQELEALAEVRSVRVESVEGGVATYIIDASSGSRLVSGLLHMPPRFRPRNLRLGVDTVDATLGIAAAPEKTAGPVFELGAEAFFTARHYVTMAGIEGPVHQHSFRVEILTESSSQDEDGVVIGFANARRMVEELVDRYNETLLNTVPPFDESPPTLENIAKVIHRELAPRLLDETVKLKQVRVWESPTNHASYSE